MSTKSVRRVVFIQKFVPHYRLPFFEKVREQLNAAGIEFVLVHGRPDPFEGSKVRTVEPEWAEKVDSHIFTFRGRYLYWQGASRFVKRGDLVVVEHAAKLLDNYWLYICNRVGFCKLSYFGHGENFQSDYELALSRWLKQQMLVKVARWFAYTDVSLDSLIRQGVPEERISVVNNTLVAPKNTFSEVAKTPGKFLYIGGLYKDKRLDLIIDAFKIVYQTHPNVRLTIVGTGPLASQVEDAASRHDGIDWLGAIYGEERNRVIAESDAILMPGLVGLVAVDAFYFRAPILTSHAGQHSPEVAYLKDGFNALFDHTSGNAESFARLMRRWLDESGLADSLREGCTIAASQYTIENMVERFIAGVSETLDH